MPNPSSNSESLTFRLERAAIALLKRNLGESIAIEHIDSASEPALPRVFVSATRQQLSLACPGKSDRTEQIWDCIVSVGLITPIAMRETESDALYEQVTDPLVTPAMSTFPTYGKALAADLYLDGQLYVHDCEFSIPEIRTISDDGMQRRRVFSFLATAEKR